MGNHDENRIWDLFVELRKELVESQKIRAQVVGFKITFVATAIGLMAANKEKIDSILFVIPAFAAICFDFIIYSYSFSIKRIGLYCREHIEPALKVKSQLPGNFTAWQEFLTHPMTRQQLSSIGNIGFTLLTVVIGWVALFYPCCTRWSIPLGVVLLAFFILDIFLGYRYPSRLGKLWHPPSGGPDKTGAQSESA